jgi:Fuc2NAc and GlcNAc transferase
MKAELLAMGAAALLLSALLTGWVLRVAIVRGILDAPNERSSHSKIMPRGGGLAIVLVSTAATLLLCARGWVDAQLTMALIGGGLPIAAIGFADDRRSVSAGIRLGVHLLAATWAVYALGGLPTLQVGLHIIDLGFAGTVLAVVAIVWVVNLFNFMDGIDGIAGSEATFMAIAGSVLMSGVVHVSGVAPAALAFAAACVGFLCWNWPPARIFMGDVGSGFLGLFIAVTALASARSAPAALFVWLILGGVFFADATMTFLCRLLRRVRVYEAHREHAYQKLARKWGGHGKVLLGTLAINLFWLLPWAWFAAENPSHAALACASALGPLFVLAWSLGAGKAN